MMLVPYLLLCVITSTLACLHGGKTYKNGDEWKEKDVFLMKCTTMEGGGWRTEVVACLSPSGKRIPLNETATEGDDEWKCTVNSNGMISLQQSVNANAKCDQHPVGDKWQDKSFEFECLRGGQQKLLNCIADDGQKIPVNGSKEVRGFLMKCEQYGNGTILLHGTRLPSRGHVSVECIDSRGVNHPVGSSWVENERFNKTCTESGHTVISNCITQNGMPVPLNQEVVHDRYRYKCQQTNEGAVRFSSEPVKQH